MTQNNLPRKIFSYIVLAVWSIIALFPFYWIVLTSFKDYLTCKSWPPSFLPFIQFQPVSLGWVDVLFGGWMSGRYIQSFSNSIVIGIISSILAIALGAPAAYSLARFRFRRPMKNNGIAFWILSQRMLPQSVVIVPFLIMFSTLNLIDTLPSIIIAHTAMNLPLVVWILREFILDLPVDFEDSARVDGCSRAGVLRHIVLPIIAPGLLVAWVLAFILSWNELFFSLILSYREVVTIPAMLINTFGGWQHLWWDMSAAATLFLIPPVILSIFIQKYIVRGLTFGAVKG